MKQLSRWIGGAVLALSAVAAQAAVVLTTPSLTGYVQFSNFSAITSPSSANTYTITFRDLQGAVNVAPAPAGQVNVSVQGTASFDLDNNGTFEFSGNAVNPLAIFSGLVTTPLAGPQTLGFNNITDGSFDSPVLLSGLTFSSSYNGAADPGVFGLINSLFGNIFSDPTGAGSLSISADVYADGAVLTVTETANWFNGLGFGGILRALDAAPGAANDGQIDGNFALTNVQVTAVPEPASLALVGLSLLGLAATRRRRS